MVMARHGGRREGDGSRREEWLEVYTIGVVDWNMGAGVEMQNQDRMHGSSHGGNGIYHQDLN
jgi:hypothetical protein